MMAKAAPKDGVHLHIVSGFRSYADLDTSPGGVYHRLENHAAHFGFKRTVPGEQWHWAWWGGGPGGGPC